ncbi:hypothetical protein H2200_008327 [Cladophialophora chaetospira]|uniref:Uncharacterized protein n=1 Tax=Cladophialophora chaetospira TaxID=386627 RepID=A0AA39CG04_9EURO|nr:hypothetical protein H2200_008327 [Cladophialophora chaetospira]
MSIEKSGNGGQAVVRSPSHPVPQLQKPFEESMLESMTDDLTDDIPADAMVRRTMLLEAPSYERVIAGRWKQKPGEKYHPLWKLVAQLTFGMHLLSENMAISEEEVMRILQAHVDDIDAFLERTTEDFDLAQSDIHERLRCLKLPLAHGDVFDRMLEDRNFRASILDGNEKIDHVIGRTKKAAKDALKDVQKGFDATNVMEKYLTKLSSTWKRESPEHEAVLVAMLGNVEGWRRAFLELHLQGNKLAGSLKKLAEVVAEMQYRAAAVSRSLVARAQKAKHITSQAGRAPSALGSVADQKPLPVEPGRRQSTRNSSRSTQLSSFSSRPNSGQKSSQGPMSQPQSIGHQSPRSADSRRPGHTVRSLSSNPSVLEDGLHTSDRMLSIGGLLIRSEDEHPIELPADVPEDALRQAPVSVKNRLSVTLGLRSKDTASHRISSVYYPQALSNLLKSPGISSLLLIPQPDLRGTPVQTMASPIMSEGEAGYFLAHEQSPSIGFVTPESKTEANSTKHSRPATRTSARASVHEGSAPATRRSSLRSPAFTSHTAVMAMATPPVELPAPLSSSSQTTIQEKRPSSSSSRKGSQSQLSSLGEPGPELAEGATTRSASVSEPRILIDTSVVTVAIVPASAEEETFAAAQERAERIEQNKVVEESTLTGTENQPQEHIVADAPHTEDSVATQLPGGDLAKEESEKPTEDAEQRLEAGDARETRTQPELVDVQPLHQESTTANSPREFVAELEAVVPKPLYFRPKEDTGPVELEAPQQTFKLPPRPIAKSTNPEKEVPRASINKLDDFFKLPSELAIKPGLKPDVKPLGSPKEEAIRRLKLTRQDGKLVPVQVDSPGGTPTSEVHSPKIKLKVDVVADIIDRISYTPVTSPIHARSASSMSSNSAQRWSHRSSRSLGTPAQAPAPPAPGGRAMIEPDFATAGQFEGERKQKKKTKKQSGSSAGSKSGWKAFFRPSTANNGSIGISESVEGSSTAAGTLSEKLESPVADMMTTSGKDVLWFRGNGKKTVSAV